MEFISFRSKLKNVLELPKRNRGKKRLNTDKANSFRKLLGELLSGNVENCPEIQFETAKIFKSAKTLASIEWNRNEETFIKHLCSKGEGSLALCYGLYYWFHSYAELDKDGVYFFPYKAIAYELDIEVFEKKLDSEFPPTYTLEECKSDDIKDQTAKEPEKHTLKHPETNLPRKKTNKEQLTLETPFESRITKLLKDWFDRPELMSKIGRFIHDNKSGLLNIIGDAGAGKSTVIAKTIQTFRIYDSYICAYHFIQYKTEYDRATSFAKSLYKQFSQQFDTEKFEERFKYFEHIAHYIHVESFVEDILQEASLQAESIGKKVIIFIDALDEADKTEQPENFAVPKEPAENVLIISSSRGKRDQKSDLSADDFVQLTLYLDKKSEIQQSDVVGFIDRKIESNGKAIREWLRKGKFSVEDFKKSIIKDSDYLFLYVVQVFKDIQLYDPQNLPKGLKGYYNVQYQRLLDNNLNREEQKAIIAALLIFEPDISIKRLNKYTSEIIKKSDVLSLCQSWIDLRLLDNFEINQERFIRFAHLSLYEYFKQEHQADLYHTAYYLECFNALARYLDSEISVIDAKMAFQEFQTHKMKEEFIRLYFLSFFKAKKYGRLDELLTSKELFVAYCNKDASYVNEFIDYGIMLFEAYESNGDEEYQNKADDFVDKFNTNIINSKTGFLDYLNFIDLVGTRRNPFLDAIADKNNINSTLKERANERKRRAQSS